MPEQVSVRVLAELLEAFNRHDLDAIMGYFADDCVLYMPRGVDLLEFEGGKVVRKDSFWKIVG